MLAYYSFLTYLCFLPLDESANLKVPPPPAMPERFGEPAESDLVTRIFSHWKNKSLDDVVSQEIEFQVYQFDHSNHVQKRGQAWLRILNRECQRIDFSPAKIPAAASDEWSLEPMPPFTIVTQDHLLSEYWFDRKEFARFELSKDKLPPIGRPLFDIHAEIPKNFMPGHALINRWESWILIAAEYRTTLLLTALSEGTHELSELFDWKPMEDHKTGPRSVCLTGYPKPKSELELSLHHVDIVFDLESLKTTGIRFADCDTSKETTYIISRRNRVTDKTSSLRLNLNNAGWRELFPW